VFQSTIFNVAINSDSHTSETPLTGGYRKYFPSAPGLPPMDVSQPVTESQLLSHTTASALQTFIPRTSMSAAMSYPISQNELAISMPDTGPSSLSYTLWDQQCNGHNLLMHSADSLGWAGSRYYSSEHNMCKSHWKHWVFSDSQYF